MSEIIIRTPSIKSIIVSVGANGEIGKNGRMGWHNVEEMKFFRKMTMNAPVIMGRKTFESLSNPLEKRYNIILTSNKKKYNHYQNNDDVRACNSLKECINLAEEYLQDNNVREEIFCIGGGEVYKQFLEFTDKMYISRMKLTLQTPDTFFPDFNKRKFELENLTMYKDFDLEIWRRRKVKKLNEEFIQ